MPIKIAMTGSGKVGDPLAGWTVNEFATPVAPGEVAGGTGGMTVSAAARDDSLFAIDNLITSTHTDPNGSLGKVSGVVKTVSQQGLNVSLSHSTVLAGLDADRVIPPLAAGSAAAALDLATQLCGTPRLASAYGKFWSLAGHLAGFDRAGKPVVFDEHEDDWTWYNNVSGLFVKATAVTNRDAMWATDFETAGGQTYATNLTGDSFGVDDSSHPTSRVAFKTLPSTGDITFSFIGYPDDSDLNTSQQVSVTLNPVGKTLTILATRRVGGMPTDAIVTVSTAAVDMTKEAAVFIDYTVTSAAFPYSYQLNVTVCNTTDYLTNATATLDYTTDNLSIWFGPWKVTGRARSVWTRNDKKTFVVSEYEAPSAYAVSGTTTHGAPVPGVAMNVWQYLQDACAAYRRELAVVNDIITVRPLGETVLDITNSVGTPTISPTSTLTGRAVEIVYSNAKLVSRQEVYAASEDDNRILSVAAGKTVTTTVQTPNHLLSVLQPKVAVPTTRGANTVGTYSVCDSTNLPIVPQQWLDYGGRLEVAISPTVPGAIDVTLIGPGTTIPSTTGPYYLSESDGSKSYAILSIIGSGVTTKLRTLTLQTGVDPSKVSTEVAKTITNVFLSNRSQAYDRGVWASMEAAGPRMTLSGSVPVSAIKGFGLVQGSLIRYRQSIYRVISATIGNLVVNFTAVRHVTVADFDAVWAGRSVASHDTVWSGYTAQDIIIAPLRP